MTSAQAGVRTRLFVVLLLSLSQNAQSFFVGVMKMKEGSYDIVPITKFSLGFENNCPFTFAKLRLFNLWGDVIVPTLAALLR
jgi:hypothetical protein